MSESIEHPFVSEQRLKDYFTNEDRAQAISADVLSHVKPRTEWSTILEEWMKVFAILLLIGRARYIGHFARNPELRDSKLPFREKPKGFPTAGPYGDLFAKFQENQWMFLPWEFRNGRNTDLIQQRILPICYRQIIGSGGSATLYAIKIHRDCDFIQNPDTGSLAGVHLAAELFPFHPSR